MIKVSFIVTAYNVSAYIKKCVQSLLEQDFEGEYEILIIEDCSTDNTYDICKDLETSNSNIRVIRNPQNLGAGLSRRRGINEAKGEYISLVDADDWVDSDYISTMLKEGQDADVISCGIKVVYEDGAVYLNKTNKFVVEGTDKFTTFLEGDIQFMNDKLIRRKLFDNVEYSERRYIEDTITMMKVAYYADKIVYIGKPMYNYLQRNGSLCHSNKEMSTLFGQIITAKQFLEFIKDKPIEYRYLMTNEIIINYIKRLKGMNLKEDDLKDCKDDVIELFIFLLKIIKI